MPSRSYFNIRLVNIKGEVLPIPFGMKTMLEDISGYQVDQSEYELKISDASWDAFGEDMKKLSRQFPDLKFIVIGEADEYQNFWHANFLNGQGCVKQAEIVYPEIKTSDLVE